MKFLDLIKILISSIDDENLSNIFDNCFELSKTEPSRWVIIWSWFKKRLMGIFMAAVMLFPEARRIKHIYDCITYIYDYSSKQNEELINKIFDSILVNYSEIENVCEFKTLATEIKIKWPEIKNAMEKNSNLYESVGIKIENPQDFLTSLAEMLRKENKLNKLAYLVDVFSTNF